MYAHKLGIEVIETSNEKVFRLVDTSIYNSLLGVTCPQLLITSPGYQYSANIDEDSLTAPFNLILTACDLEVQTRKCDSEHHEIPDGVYAIQYSVAPNEYTAVTINHLRLTKTYQRIRQIYCELDLGACMVDKDKEKKLLELRLIQDYLQAAKAKVEICNELSKGMTIYKYALKLLDKIDCKSCH